MKEYLTDIPDIVNDYGFCKVLLVRREMIHIKHIFTEIFIRKKISIEKRLCDLDMSLTKYMEIMTQKTRRIHRFSRLYNTDCNKIVKYKKNRFFPTLELMEGLKNCIVLDFDGVVTDNKFRHLYDLCLYRCETQICSANPTISDAYFIKNDMPLPSKINSMKGKHKKIKKLIAISTKYDNVFFVDNEVEYLKYAWIFGIKTYLWDGKEIKHFSMNSK